MGPKLLGGTVSLLAAAFILALPSMFKGEPADEVEPIKFGPPPVARLAQAVQVVAPEPAFSPSTGVIPPATPSLASGGGGEGGRAAAGTPVASAQEGPGNDVRPAANENESQGGTGASNGNGTAEGEDVEDDDVDDDSEVGERDDAGGDEEVNEVDEDDDEEEEEDD
jgi:hypothetical protein